MLLPASCSMEHSTNSQFPKLKLVILEVGAGWIQYWCDRMDAIYHSHAGRKVPLREKPSFYFKQQPNLLFAAVKYLYGTPGNWSNFRRLLLGHGDEIRATIMARTTQTNEPARCTTLLPLLARLRWRLALLEVGAAAGLCLLPDAYAYDYDGYRVPPTSFTSATPPTFFCRVPRAPLPDRGLENYLTSWFGPKTDRYKGPRTDRLARSASVAR
jgi:Uncharacterized protein conserved in bacteria (DUF2332)